MAKKSGNLLIKVVVLLAVAGAVFFALDSWRKKSGSGETATPETAVTDTSATTVGLSREEAERLGTEIGTRIGTEVGTQIGREVAAQMLAERKAQAASARPATAPKPAAAEPTPAPAPAETATTEPTVTETASAPAAPAAPRETRTQGTIPGIPVAESSVGRDPWWIKSNTGDASALALTYAGSFKSTDGKQTGIALEFTGRFDGQTDFASGISISGGGDTAGKWRLGASRGLIYLPGLASGNYTVTVRAGFKDSDGKAVKADISGPVEVK
jgi:hypothetical protein